MFRELYIYFTEIGIEVERERGKSEKKKSINNHIHLRGNERRERGKKKNNKKGDKSPVARNLPLMVNINGKHHFGKSLNFQLLQPFTLLEKPTKNNVGVYSFGFL